MIAQMLRCWMIALLLLPITAAVARAQATSPASPVPIAHAGAPLHAAAASGAAARNAWTMPTPVVAPAGLFAEQQGSRTRRWEGAAVGFAVGAVATWVFLHQGGSTSLCDRDRNQDAIRANECAGIAVAGGAVGAAIGYFIGGRIRIGPAR